MQALSYEPMREQTLQELNQSLNAEFERNAGIVKTFNIQP